MGHHGSPDASVKRPMVSSQDEAFEIFKDSGFVLVKDAPLAAGLRGGNCM